MCVCINLLFCVICKINQSVCKYRMWPFFTVFPNDPRCICNYTLFLVLLLTIPALCLLLFVQPLLLLLFLLLLYLLLLQLLSVCCSVSFHLRRHTFSRHVRASTRVLVWPLSVGRSPCQGEWEKYVVLPKPKNKKVFLPPAGRMMHQQQGSKL